MINIEKMWKSINLCRKTKRNIKEVIFSDININEYIIIDVRSRREFRENHLNSSINIPLPDIQKNIMKYVKNKEEKILVCCEYGGRSAKAAQILEKLGYLNVYNLKGGLENI